MTSSVRSNSVTSSKFAAHFLARAWYGHLVTAVASAAVFAAIAGIAKVALLSAAVAVTIASSTLLYVSIRGVLPQNYHLFSWNDPALQTTLHKILRTAAEIWKHPTLCALATAGAALIILEFSSAFLCAAGIYAVRTLRDCFWKEELPARSTANALLFANEAKYIQVTPTYEEHFSVFPKEHISFEIAKAQYYTYRQLKQLFDGSLEEFQKASDAAVIRTGNWKAKELGHSPKVVALIHVAVARLLNRPMIYYNPQGDDKDICQAKEIIQAIEAQHPEFTVDQFLHHVAGNSEKYLLHAAS